MKKLSKREKILLIILVVVIIGVSWYKFIYEPTTNKIDTMTRNRDTEMSELTALQPKIKQKKDMQAAVEKIKAQDKVEKIPTYDNSKELMVALNKVMAAAKSYSVDFGAASKDDYIFLHKLLLTFTTDGYQQARQLIQKLTTETFVNQISNINVTNDFQTRNIVNAKGETVQRVTEETKVTLTITFFEIDG